MARAAGAGLVLAFLVVGALVGLAGVAVHELWWGQLLTVVGMVALELAAAPGWQRIALTIGWVALLAYTMAERPEGDFVITEDFGGYLLVGLTVLVILFTTATLSFKPRRAE